MAPNVGLGTEGPVQRGWGLWLTSVLAVVIAALFVGARLAQRLSKRSGLGMDDYMIILALISSGLLSMTECQGGHCHRIILMWLTIEQLWCMVTVDTGQHSQRTLE